MIKKRNLDPSLVQWIMTTTGLGPGIGNIKYLVPSASSTSQFRTQLQSMGVSDGDMYTSLASAYADLVAYRNDILLVAPGLFTETAACTWAKDSTHMIGMGGPATVTDYTYTHFPVIYTSTAAVASVISVTGKGCQFHNVCLENNGANAGNLNGLDIDAEGCYCEQMVIHGNMNSTQNAVAAASSLRISDGGFYPTLIDCIIGQNEWGTRAAANSGVIYFAGPATAPSNGYLKGCRILSIATTATIAAVAVPAVDYIGRGWVFDNCVFVNIDGSANGNLNQVFYLNNAGSDNRPIVLHHCMAEGFDEWQDADGSPTLLVADMPIVGTGGGLGYQPTASAGS